MLCPKCNCEMSVVKGYNILKNDDTPDKETKLYRVVVHKCNNKKCSNQDEIKEQIELKIGE